MLRISSVLYLQQVWTRPAFVTLESHTTTSVGIQTDNNLQEQVYDTNTASTSTHKYEQTTEPNSPVVSKHSISSTTTLPQTPEITIEPAFLEDEHNNNTSESTLVHEPEHTHELTLAHKPESISESAFIHEPQNVSEPTLVESPEDISEPTLIDELKHAIEPTITTLTNEPENTSESTLSQQFEPVIPDFSDHPIKSNNLPSERHKAPQGDILLIHPSDPLPKAVKQDLFLDEGTVEGDQHDLPSASDCTSSLHTSVSSSHTETPNHDELPPKFSPKKILYRARSSLTEESVRNLGRRTSLFFDKISTTSSETTIKSLRRQSSKLTSKGKSFTKKLKKAVSFHPQQAQAIF